MASFIIILIVIIAILLGAVILIQNPKGGGLAVGFTGGSQLGGVQRTTEFMEKATWYLAIAMMVLCLVSAAYFTEQQPVTDGSEEPQIEQSTEGTGTDEAPAP